MHEILAQTRALPKNVWNSDGSSGTERGLVKGALSSLILLTPQTAAYIVTAPVLWTEFTNPFYGKESPARVRVVEETCDKFQDIMSKAKRSLYDRKVSMDSGT